MSVQNQQPTHATARIVVDSQAQKPGEPVWVGVEMTMDPGWHIYWSNPGDSGVPPSVEWSLPEGFVMEGPFFGAPKRITTEYETTFGYEGTTTILYRLKVPQDYVGEVELKGDARWLVCKEACLPGSASLTSKVRLPLDSSVSRGSLRPAVAALPKEFGKGRSKATVSGDAYLLSLDVKGTELESRDDFEFFPSEEGQFTSAKPKVTLEGGVLTFHLKPSEYLTEKLEWVQGLVIGRKKGTSGEIVEFPVNIKAPVS